MLRDSRLTLWITCVVLFFIPQVCEPLDLPYNSKSFSDDLQKFSDLWSGWRSAKIALAAAQATNASVHEALRCNETKHAAALQDVEVAQGRLLQAEAVCSELSEGYRLAQVTLDLAADFEASNYTAAMAARASKEDAYGTTAPQLEEAKVAEETAMALYKEAGGYHQAAVSDAKVKAGNASDAIDLRMASGEVIAMARRQREAAIRNLQLSQKKVDEAEKEEKAVRLEIKAAENRLFKMRETHVQQWGNNASIQCLLASKITDWNDSSIIWNQTHLRKQAAVEDRSPSTGTSDSRVQSASEIDVQQSKPLIDKHELCWKWAAAGECINNVKYMLKACKKSCALMSPGVMSDTTTTGSAGTCTATPRPEMHLIDLNEFCQTWAASGECVNNQKYMLKQCNKSCEAHVPVPPPLQSCVPETKAVPETQVEPSGRNATMSVEKEAISESNVASQMLDAPQAFPEEVDMALQAVRDAASNLYTAQKEEAASLQRLDTQHEAVGVAEEAVKNIDIRMIRVIEASGIARGQVRQAQIALHLWDHHVAANTTAVMEANMTLRDEQDSMRAAERSVAEAGVLAEALEKAWDSARLFSAQQHEARRRAEERANALATHVKEQNASLQENLTTAVSLWLEPQDCSEGCQWSHNLLETVKSTGISLLSSVESLVAKHVLDEDWRDRAAELMRDMEDFDAAAKHSQEALAAARAAELQANNAQLSAEKAQIATEKAKITANHWMQLVAAAEEKLTNAEVALHEATETRSAVQAWIEGAHAEFLAAEEEVRRVTASQASARNNLRTELHKRSELQRAIEVSKSAVQLLEEELELRRTRWLQLRCGASRNQLDSYLEKEAHLNELWTAVEVAKEALPAAQAKWTEQVLQSMRRSEERGEAEKEVEEALKYLENITSSVEAAQAVAKEAQVPVRERAEKLAEAESALKAAQQQRQELLQIRSSWDNLLNETILSHIKANKSMHKAIQENSAQLAALEAAQNDVADEKRLLAAAQTVEASAWRELTAARRWVASKVVALNLEEQIRVVKAIEDVEAKLQLLYEWLTSPLMVAILALLGTVAVLNAVLDRLDRMELGVSVQLTADNSKPVKEPDKGKEEANMMPVKVPEKIVEAEKPPSSTHLVHAAPKTLADLIREHHEKSTIDTAGREDFADPDSEPEATVPQSQQKPQQQQQQEENEKQHEQEKQQKPAPRSRIDRVRRWVEAGSLRWAPSRAPSTYSV